MSKTVKQISKIKLKDGGFKGVEVTYTYPQEKDGLIWANEHIEKRKHPIHTDLKKAINDLRNFMLEVYNYIPDGLSVADKDYLIEDTRVIQIDICGTDSFKLSGDMRLIGDKVGKIPGIKVEAADGYAHFETVMNIIKVIKDETMEYMAGKKKLDEGQFMLDFAKKRGDEVLIKEFASMGTKEKMDKCREFLEQCGGIVLINEELDVNEIQTTVDFTPQTEVEEITVFIEPTTEQKEKIEQIRNEAKKVDPVMNQVPLTPIEVFPVSLETEMIPATQQSFVIPAPTMGLPVF